MDTLTGGFKAKEMWNDKEDKFRKLDVIAIIWNRIKAAMVVFYIIMLIISIVVAIITIIFKSGSN